MDAVLQIELLALAHLVARLRAGGWKLLDCQFITPHLASLGAIEIRQADYLARLYSVLAGGDGAVSVFLDIINLPLARRTSHRSAWYAGAQ